MFQCAARRMAHCLFVIALRRWSCSCSSRCECVSVSTSVSSVVRIVYFTTYKFWTGRSVEVIPGGRANADQRFISVACSFVDNARASWRFPFHVDVFVLTLFRRVRTV